jgi:hypothetical protein
MAEIICYTRILRWKVRRGKTELDKQEIEFCKNYLIENVPKAKSYIFKL